MFSLFHRVESLVPWTPMQTPVTARAHWRLAQRCSRPWVSSVAGTAVNMSNSHGSWGDGNHLRRDILSIYLCALCSANHNCFAGFELCGRTIIDAGTAVLFPVALKLSPKHCTIFQFAIEPFFINRTAAPTASLVQPRQHQQRLLVPHCWSLTAHPGT